MSTSTIPKLPQLLCLHGEEQGCCSICQSIATLTQQTLSAQLDELLDAARPRLLRLAVLSGLTHDQAEDVVQETSIEAWRHLGNLREPAKFAYWLDGICRNICRRHLRTRTEQRAHEISLLAGEDERDNAAFDLPDPFVIDPHEDLIRQDMQLLLDHALSYLPASTRELIERCYLAEQPQREVAEQLGMSIGALELRLYRARQRLSKVLRSDMRADMQEFGLFLHEDELSGWQETHYWCWFCGKKRMRASFVTQSTNQFSLRMRCPDCWQKYHTNILDSGNISIRGRNSLRAFRPALKRVLPEIANFYGKAIYEQRCIVCQGPAQARLVDRDTSDIDNDFLSSIKNFPRNFYVYIKCSNCGPSFSDLVGIAISEEVEFRSFLLDRSHVVMEPSTIVPYAGQNAIRSRLLDLKTGEQLTTMIHPQTLHIMATF